MKQLLRNLIILSLALVSAKAFAGDSLNFGGIPKEDAEALHTAFKGSRTMDTGVALAFGDTVTDASELSKQIGERIKTCTLQTQIGDGNTSILRTANGQGCITDYVSKAQITNPTPTQTNLVLGSGTQVRTTDLWPLLGIIKSSMGINFVSHDHPDKTWDSTGETSLNLTSTSNTAIALTTKNASTGYTTKNGDTVELVITHTDLSGTILYDGKQIVGTLTLDAPADGKKDPVVTCTLNSDSAQCQALAYIIGFDTTKQMTAVKMHRVR